MQRAEREVAGFGDAQRRFNGLQVAHFADQHHVGIFTKRGSQRIGEALGVGMHFALIDHAILIHVHELDRVLDSEDVVVPLGIDLVNHGGERSGFARSGRAGDQHQAARLVAHLAHNRWKSQLVKRLDLEGNQTKDGRSRTPLVEYVGAETGQTFQSEREIQLQILFETMLLRIGHNAVGQLFGLGRRHLRQVQRHQVPVHADLRRRIRSKVKIASRHLQHSFQQIT